MKMKALYAALSGAILLSAATLAPAADTTKPASTAVKDAAGETAARTKGVASRGTSEVAAATHMDKSAYTAEREKAEADPLHAPADEKSPCHAHGAHGPRS